MPVASTSTYNKQTCNSNTITASTSKTNVRLNNDQFWTFTKELQVILAKNQSPQAIGSKLITFAKQQGIIDESINLADGIKIFNQHGSNK